MMFFCMRCHDEGRREQLRGTYGAGQECRVCWDEDLAVLQGSLEVDFSDREAIRRIVDLLARAPGLSR